MSKREEIDSLGRKLHLKFNDFNDKNTKDVAIKLVNLIISENSILEKKYDSILIDAYKFLSEVEYLEKNYECCLDYIKRLQSCDAYKKENDRDIVHAIVRKFQCEVYLNIYKNKHEEIELLRENMVQYYEDRKSKFCDSLRADYDKIVDLANSYLNDSIKTIVSFKLPYKIDISNNDEVIYSYNNIEFRLSFKVINNPRFFESNGVIELDKDKYGDCSYSILTMTLSKFFDATHCTEKLIELCCNSFNFFLDHYRSVTEYYWIDRLNLKQISSFNIEVRSKNNKIITIPFYYPHCIKVLDSPEYISEEKLNKLKNNLTNKLQIPLWRSLYLDSKDNFLIGKYRESVIAINSAFENYLNIRSRKILGEKMTTEEVGNYLKGKITYETYILNKYISKENFEKAIKEGLISSYAPSTYQIIKKCFGISNNKIKVSNTKVKNLINKIRKNRNDIIHANSINLKGIEADAKKSISSFEEFTKVF